MFSRGFFAKLMEIILCYIYNSDKNNFIEFTITFHLCHNEMVYRNSFFAMSNIYTNGWSERIKRMKFTKDER